MEGRDITWTRPLQQSGGSHHQRDRRAQTVAGTGSHWPNSRSRRNGGARLSASLPTFAKPVQKTTRERRCTCPRPNSSGPEGCYLVLRSKLPPADTREVVMRTLRDINPGQPATEFKPIQTLVDHATSPQTLLCAAGRNLCRSRTSSRFAWNLWRHLLFRYAANTGDRHPHGAWCHAIVVQLDVIWKTLRLALIGIAVGFLASLVLARLIASLLFQTAPTDPPTFVGMVTLLGAVALLAGYLPARRASKIDPMVALRTN